MTENEGQAPTPWLQTPEACLRWLRERVSWQSMAFGVIDVRQPQLDEILAAEGWSDPDLVREWCDRGHRADPLFAEARSAGRAVHSPNGGRPVASLIGSRHALVCMSPESHADSRYWWLLLVRDDAHGGAFEAREQQLAEIVLRQWQHSLHNLPEPDMGRLVFGNDARLLVADLNTRSRWIREDREANGFLGAVRPVIEQRYPTLEDHVTRDVAMSIDGADHWILFRRGRAMPESDSFHWIFELRRLDADDLPPVGEVSDDRIAQSVAFLHDHFRESPTLAEVAERANMSPFHFHRLFTRQVGVSPKQYLQRRQLQVAKWLLRTGRTPIGQIASETGFSSHGHFTSTFHRLVGVSPSTYREQW